MTHWDSGNAAARTVHLNNQYWAVALEGSGIGVWEWDVTANRVVRSSEWNALFGYAEGAVGNSFDEWCALIHPDDRLEARAALQQLVQGGIPGVLLIIGCGARMGPTNGSIHEERLFHELKMVHPSVSLAPIGILQSRSNLSRG